MNNKFRVLKGVMTSVAPEVAGYNTCTDRIKGNGWRTSEIKEAIERNRKECKEMLQGTVGGEIRRQ